MMGVSDRPCPLLSACTLVFKSRCELFGIMSMAEIPEFLGQGLRRVSRNGLGAEVRFEAHSSWFGACGSECFFTGQAGHQGWNCFCPPDVTSSTQFAGTKSLRLVAEYSGFEIFTGQFYFDTKLVIEGFKFSVCEVLYQDQVYMFDIRPLHIVTYIEESYVRVQESGSTD